MKLRNLLYISLFLLPNAVNGAADDELLYRAYEAYNVARVACSGIADEISKVTNISTANTVVSSVGTVASGGALVAGIAKSKEEERIDELIAEICESGGCDADSVVTMSNQEFFEHVISPMAEIVELQESINRSKQLGNWRTGLMAGTIGTNLATAIMSGLNTNQSDLVQHIDACNMAIETVDSVVNELKTSGINPYENPIVNQLNGIGTYCSQMNLSDIEKIENRMKGVMGTSIAGGVIGVVGTTTSAVANSDKYMDPVNKIRLTDAERDKERALNTTANVMAGANVVTGAVNAGLSISLITLTKKMINSAQNCEDSFND